MNHVTYLNTISGWFYKSSHNEFEKIISITCNWAYEFNYKFEIAVVSANDDVANIMRSIKHGARDYLLKPVRLQEMMNIWQHVIRKNNITKEVTYKKTLSKKRSRDQPRKEEDETNTQSEIVSSTRKKSRLSWTPQLHLKFLNAIQELGDDGKSFNVLHILFFASVS